MIPTRTKLIAILGANLLGLAGCSDRVLDPGAGDREGDSAGTADPNNTEACAGVESAVSSAFGRGLSEAPAFRETCEVVALKSDGVSKPVELACPGTPEALFKVATDHPLPSDLEVGGTYSVAWDSGFDSIRCGYNRLELRDDAGLLLGLVQLDCAENEPLLGFDPLEVQIDYVCDRPDAEDCGAKVPLGFSIDVAGETTTMGAAVREASISARPHSYRVLIGKSWQCGVEEDGPKEHAELYIGRM